MASELTLFKPTLPTRERRQISREELREKYCRPTSSLHILLEVDATGSMASYWNEVARTLDEIIRRVLAIGGNVAMKIVAYRDHCDGARIVEASAWSQQADDLKRFVTGITCDGGGDTPEAVDRALQVALQEQEVSRVILIGDAPPHAAQDCTKEAQELGQKKRPVYPIVIGQDPQTHEAFARIASLSGGKVIALTNLDELFELITILTVHAMGDEALRRYAMKNPALRQGAKQLLLELRT